MAAIAGKDGQVQLGANVVAETTNWSLDITVDPIDTTVHLDEWREFIAGLRGWSGTIEASWDMTDTNGQLALQALMTGTPAVIAVELWTANLLGYSGDIWVTGISVGTPVEDKVSVSFSFTGNSALSYGAVS